VLLPVRRACCRPCRVGSQLTTAKTFQEPGRSLSSWLPRLSSRMGASATRSWMVRETLCDAREGPIRGLPRYQGSRDPRCAAADPAVRGRRRGPGQAGAAATDALDRLQPVPTTLGSSTSSSTGSSAKVAKLPVYARWIEGGGRMVTGTGQPGSSCRRWSAPW